MGKLRIPVQDFGTDRSTASLPVDDAVLDAAITSLFNAIDAVIIGAIGQSVLVTEADKDAGPGGAAGSGNAQVEVKWLCRYHDAVTLKNRTLELPCADLSLLAGGSEFLDLGAGVGATLKTEFEATVEDPDTGNAVVLDSLQFVGRS